MRIFLIALLTFFAGTAVSQNLTGIWRGTLTQNAGGCFPEYHLEIQLTVSGNTLQGNSYDYFDTNRFVKHKFAGRYNTQTHRMVLIESELQEFHIPGDCVPCTKTYDLTWQQSGQQESLTGEWKGIKTDSRDACPPGKITLYRVSTTDFPVDVEQPAALASLQPSLKLQKRENQLFGTIDLETPSVKIDLYDNAEIDNDTVTVFLNNKLLLYRQRLTDKPLTLTLNAFPDTDYELVMYADNLGSIPPNTALMVVTAGKQKQEVRLSASDQKNAAVRFRVKKK
ncbi:hypothetical protein [Flavihumibacter petaseus]|uniref:Lipocalin-like domain-containing protein n=1 Tax=Flavihumibacter petaseus NBRC 106054 TaxID=1220578 RepID=A0A0E9N8E5_9BACT|nr:hypothetical protein [Flavihumibacter petaseus]GAO45660.1 hypothetical protein FPE01S_07_00480 [Flavihumibacter petaseus NBRC 106054]